MKNINLFKIYTLAALLLMGSCAKKFDQMAIDANRPTQVPAALVLHGILYDYYQIAPFSQSMRWNQFSNCNYNYYGNQEYIWTGVSYGSYNTIKNIVKMEQEAIRVGLKTVNPYAALGKFFRAHFFYELSMRVGDIPMKDAVKGIENFTPTYDTQKEVMIQVLKWLEEANADLKTLTAENNNQLTGDFYFSNKLDRWRKAVNAMRLRVLMQLSKKEGDAEVSLKSRLANIMSNPTENPLFESNTESLQFVYNSQFNKYPVNPDNYGFDATRYNMSATYLNNLAALKDPRTFVTAEPAPKQLAAGKLPSDYSAYNGASSGEDLADMSTKANNGDYSFYNRKKYYTTYTSEPCILLGYPEMCFNIAEAINRNFITGSAEEWYVKGIKASHEFYGIKEGANTFYYQKPGGTKDESIAYTATFVWADYYAQPSVKYAGNTADGWKQIIQQKYFAFYQNSGMEAYYNWRRTGFPTFLTGPGTGNSQRIAKRFLYPSNESVTNKENVSAAVKRQFGTTDDINAEMWIIK